MRRSSRYAVLGAVLALTLLGGCAARQAVPARQAGGPGLSPEARIQYYYLVYQDQILRLQRLTRTQPLNQETLAEALGYQKIAAEALDRVLAEQPSADLYLDKANLYWNNEQVGLARQALEEGLGRYPDDRSLNLYLANAWLMENKPDQAAAVFDAYVARFPKDDQAREQFAQVLVDLREYARALDALKPLLGPKADPELLFLAAQAESGLGRHRQALATLRRVLAQNPEDFDALSLQAYQHEMLKDYPAAVKAYTRLLKADETRDEVRLRLVSLLLKLNNPERALALVREGAREKLFLLEAAETFLREGFAAQASAVLDLLAEGAPLSSEYYLYKAMIAYEGRNDPGAALKFLERVPEGDPAAAQAMQFRIQILAAEKRMDEALATAVEGEKRYPDQSRFYILQAGLLAEGRKLDEARVVMERGVARLPGDTELLYRYGLLRREMGDEAGALETMEQVIAKNPEHAEALNYVGYTLADEGRDLDRALVLVNSALRQDPANGFMIDSLAWVYFRMGRLHEAWTEIRRAVTAVPGDPELWNHYGDIARSLGRGSDARRGYANALKKNHKDPATIQKKLNEL